MNVPNLERAERITADLSGINRTFAAMASDISGIRRVVSKAADLSDINRTFAAMASDLSGIRRVVSRAADLSDTYRTFAAMAPDLSGIRGVVSKAADLSDINRTFAAMASDLSGIRRVVSRAADLSDTYRTFAAMAPDLLGVNRATLPAMQKAAVEAASSISARPPDILRPVVDPESAGDGIRSGESFFGREDHAILLDLKIPLCSVQLRASYPDDSFDLMASHLLAVIERSLRVFVVKRMQFMYGPKWFERRVPRHLLKRWKSREERDGSRYPIIQYSSLMDLLEVITYRDNWTSVFQSTFGEIEDISVSFRRLSPIRNHIAHNRNLSKEDQFTLIAETYRILGQIRCSP